MISLNNYEVWFITGSQHLYGEETLKQVAGNSEIIVREFNAADIIPVNIVFKSVLTTPDEISNVVLDANSSRKCIGLIAWMHTFSPAKMWINGLSLLHKPLLHLHTQFNLGIPWNSIDMDFMNLNQAAHGDREFGFICSRMNKNRKVITGHWTDTNVRNDISVWMRAAAAKADMQDMKIARFGDNMREVAVTEGNKVSAQMKFGFSVNGFGVGELVRAVNDITEMEIDDLVGVYRESYILTPDAEKNTSRHVNLRESARIELGMRAFLDSGNFSAFTTTFEDLHGLKQLPGLAVQRLMNDGYGFGAEGDWKTAAMVRAVKVMASGLKGGTSFMEDYTYHLNPSGMKVLGAHMLEVCESLASSKPRLEVHHLGIGGKDDPPRLVFTAPAGPAVNVSLLDMGERFRLLANEVEVVEPEEALPKLPVARALWIPEPDLVTSATAWIYAGGAHHTVFSQAITSEFLKDFAEMFDVEYLQIDSTTNVDDFKKELRWNEIYYRS